MKPVCRVFVVGLFALTLAYPFAISAQWNKKPYTEWTEKEATKLLNDSPWGQTQSLTDTSQMTGQARVDSAMSTFVQYPRDSPFVVEGYAREVTNDRRYLASRYRSQLVRDYIVAKFGLNPNYVASMPLGEKAVGSPDGNHWDGVALALFVATSAM